MISGNSMGIEMRLRTLCRFTILICSMYYIHYLWGRVIYLELEMIRH